MVKKPLSVIMAKAVNAEFTLLDRKIFNILLANAYNEMDTKTVHTISMRDLCDKLMLGSHESRDRIYKSIDRLFEGEIEIKYRKDDDEVLMRCRYLSFERSTRGDGYLKYAFDQMLLGFLREPQVWALIRLPVTSKFSTTYALRLYEVMQTHVGRWSPVWEVPIKEAMTYFEVSGSNARVDNFKERVVAKAVDEVNHYAEFDVKADYVRQGRGGKVSGIIFTAAQKSMSDIASLPDMTRIDKAKAKLKGRDADTVDMFSGQSDNERGNLLPQLRPETMAEARRMIGADGIAEEFFDHWVLEFRSRNISRDLDEWFLAWLRLELDRMRVDSMRDIDVDAIFENLLDS